MVVVDRRTGVSCGYTPPGASPDPSVMPLGADTVLGSACVVAAAKLDADQFAHGLQGRVPAPLPWTRLFAGICCPVGHESRSWHTSGSEGLLPSNAFRKDSRAGLVVESAQIIWYLPGIVSSNYWVALVIFYPQIFQYLGRADRWWRRQRNAPP